MNAEYFKRISNIINMSDISDSDKIMMIKNVGEKLEPENVPNPKIPEGGDEIMDKDKSGLEISLTNASDYPKTYYIRHMEKGLCYYPSRNITFLLRDEVLQNMKSTFINKPLYISHKDLKDDKPENLEKNMHGIVADNIYNELDAWYWAKVIVFSDEANEKIKSGWSASNSYIPKAINNAKEDDLYHNIKYDAEIMDGAYNHMALVPEPRYEGVMILTPEEYKEYNNNLKVKFSECQNSKERKKTMSLKFWKKKEIENTEDIMDSFVEIEGNNIAVSELVSLFKNEKEEVGKKEAEKEMEIEINGKKISMNELIAHYKNKLDNATEEMKKKDEADKKIAETDNRYYDAMSNSLENGLNKQAKFDEVYYDSLQDKLNRGKEY